MAKKSEMEIRQFCQPQSAVITAADGEELFRIDLPAQTMGFDPKKGEGKPYKVDFTLTPGKRALRRKTDEGEESAPGPAHGNWSALDFGQLHRRAETLLCEAARWARDDSALRLIDVIDDPKAKLIASYSAAQGGPCLELTLLDLCFAPAPWKTAMFAPLEAMAKAFEADREAFEQKLKAKKERLDETGDPCTSNE